MVVAGVVLGVVVGVGVVLAIALVVGVVVVLGVVVGVGVGVVLVVALAIAVGGAMRTSDVVKSKFFRAVDVQGKPPLTLTIADVSEELVGRGTRQEVKCYLWFHESPKGLGLNKTRVKVLESAYGPETDLWSGKKVRLYFDPGIEFGGRAVGGVGIQTPPGAIYVPTAGVHAGWGDAPAAAAAPPGAPPAPVWDAQARQWITQQPGPVKPPPPVWNPQTGQWDTVNPATGEIAAPAQPRQSRPATISERINAGHPPAPTDDGWGALPPAQSDDDPEFGHPDIPF